MNKDSESLSEREKFEGMQGRKNVNEKRGGTKDINSVQLDQ